MLSTPQKEVTPQAVPCVVLADDDDEARTVIAERLRSEGLKVIEASDGLELSVTLAECAEHELPALLISDIRMPWASGLEVTRKLRTGPTWVPVILISAHADPELYDEAHRLRVDCVLTKPLDLTELCRAASRLAWQPLRSPT